LLQLRVAIIEELEAKIDKLEAASRMSAPNWNPGVWTPQYQPTITTPWIGNPQPFIPGMQSGSITISNVCPDGQIHQYGTNAGPCTRCGQSLGTLTGIAITGGTVTSGASTSGYIAPVHTT